ncbi:MAG: phage major capsid protein [Proteobacteria bacterium]|nr:phage major capsid protein [Pseudomonadota bacterium]
MNMQQTSLTTAFDELNQSFIEFKDQYCSRLDKLETKSQFLKTKVDLLTVSQNRPYVENQEYHNKDFQDFVRKGSQSPQLEVKALTTSTDAAGGYLVPKNVCDTIYSLLQKTSIMRQLCRITQITTDSLDLLIDKDQMEAGWTSETTELKDTQTPELLKIKIPVHQIYAKPKASQRLLDDASINVEEWISQKIAHQIAMLENQAFIKGEGESKPKGFLSYPTTPLGSPVWGKIETVKTGKNGDIPHSDILLDVFHSLEPQYLQGAVWLMSRSALSCIRKLKDKITGAYLFQPSVFSDQLSTLLGHPVYLCDDIPALISSKASQSVAFGNFKEAYQIVDRSDITLLRDPYSSKPYVEFYATKRVGGDVINFNALKLINFSE